MSVWDGHVGLLKNACVPSLAWPKNAAALDGVTFSVLTKGIHQEEVTEILKSSGIKFSSIEFTILGPEFEINPHASGMFIKEWICREFSKAVTYNQAIILTPPDTIFGDGSIHNLRVTGNRRDVVVFAAHMRVLPTIMDQITEPVSNAKLVSLAMKHKHKTWEESELGATEINTYVGGVVWQYLDCDLYACQHLLPTPYFINPTPEDLVYFKNQIHWGVIDHDWPGECLINSERQRVLGSSDAAFMVELTPAEANIPPKAPYREDEPDLFWRRKPHNAINRMNYIILRGEE